MCRLVGSGAAKTWSFGGPSLPLGASHSGSFIVGLRIPLSESTSTATADKPTLQRQAVADHRQTLQIHSINSVLTTVTRCSPCRRSPRCVAASIDEASGARADQVTTGAHRQAHRRCPGRYPLVSRIQAYRTGRETTVLTMKQRLPAHGPVPRYDHLRSPGDSKHRP